MDNIRDIKTGQPFQLKKGGHNSGSGGGDMTQLEKRVERLEDKVEDLTVAIRVGFGNVDSRFESSEAKIDTKFANIKLWFVATSVALFFANASFMFALHRFFGAS